MSNNQSEQMRFDVDGEPLALAIKRVASQLRIVEKEYSSLGKMSKLTTEQMTAEQTRLIALYIKDEQQYNKLIQQKIQMAKQSEMTNAIITKGTTAAAMSAGKMNMMIGQGAFALDDFMTVAQMTNFSTEGMIAGLRAAANNFSVLLMHINPLLAVVPSLVTGVGGSLVKAFMNAGEKAESLGDKTERINKLMDEFNKKVKSLQFGDRILANMEEDAKLNSAIHEQSIIQANAEAAFNDFKPTFKEMKPWFGDWEKSVFEEDERKRLVLEGTAKKEKQKLKEMQDKQTYYRETRTAEQKFEPFQGMLGSMADKLAQQGLNEGQISAALMESGVSLRDGTMPEQKIFDRVAHDAWIKRLTADPEQREKAASPLKLKIDQNANESLKLGIERDEAELAAGGKLRRPDKKRFDDEQKKLDIEAKKLELQQRQEELDKENNKKMDKQIQQQQQLIDLQQKMLNIFDQAFNKRPVPGMNANV